MNNGEFCGGCRFFVESDDNIWGSCHRYPPVIYTADADGDQKQAHPEVAKISCCGEFRPKVVDRVPQPVVD